MSQNKKVSTQKDSAQQKNFPYDEQTLRQYLLDHPDASVESMHKDLGVRYKTLYKALKHYGLYTRFRRPFVPALTQEAFQGYLSGHSETTQEDMCLYFKMRKRDLRKHLTYYGLPCPPCISMKERLEIYLRDHPEATYQEISAALGRSKSSIKSVFDRYGIPYKWSPEMKYVREKLSAYLDAHPEATYKDLTRVFGGTKSGVYVALKRYGLRHPWPSSVFYYDYEALKKHMLAHPEASLQELRDVFGGTGNQMRAALKKLGFPLPKHPLIKYDRDLLEIYLLDHPMADYHELARIFKGSRSGVYTALKRYGLVTVQQHRISVKYPKDAVEKWIADHPEGTYSQLSKAFKTTSKRIYHVLVRYGLPRPKHPLIKLTKQALSDYLSDHPEATIDIIAEVFGCTSAAVRYAIKKHGFYVRPVQRGVRRKYNYEEIRSYLACHPQATYVDLSEHFHISRKSLYAVLKRGKMPIPQYALKKYDKDSLESYLASHLGATCTDLVRYFKGSDSGVRRAVKRYGLVMKKS